MKNSRDVAVRSAHGSARVLPRLVAGATAMAVVGAGLLVVGQSAQADVYPGQVIAWSSNFTAEVTVPAAAQSGVTAIAAAGGGHVLALTSDGSVVGWGIDYGAVPAAAQSGVTAIAAGQGQSLALKSDGSVVGWGDNSSGQAAVPAAAQSGVTAIAAGQVYSAALKSDGSVIAWGTNSYGQLDVPASAASGVVAIAGGGTHELALKSDGSVVAWGDDRYGQTDVPVAAQSGVTAIAAGNHYSLALKSNGSVVAWGDDSKGQTDIPSAAQSGVVKIAAGTNHALALTSTGSVIGWGSTSDGVLNIPAGVQNSGVTQIAAGTGFSLVLQSPQSPTFTAYAPPMETPLGAPYSYSFAATGWPAPTFALADGTLPTGLSIDPASGLLAGTPTQTGGFRFKVSASNGVGSPAVTGWLGLSVLQAPAFASQSVQVSGTVGSAFSSASPATGYPAPTYSIGSGSLPAGLSLDAATGAVSGTPRYAGTSTFAIHAANTAGGADRAVSLTVNPATAGQVVVAAPPASVQPGAWESNTNARVFAERTRLVLSAPLTVGGTTIPAGTAVNSFYVHADAVGDANVATAFAGSVSFGDKILAVATTTADLEATNAVLGNPAVTYSTSTDQGLEAGDTATTGSTVGKVNLSLTVYNTSDAVRVITLAQ